MSENGARTVLQYWYLLNFLEQEGYPGGMIAEKPKDEEIYFKKLKMGVIEHPRTSMVIKRERNISELNPDLIKEFIETEKKNYGFSECGEITVYLGSFSREACLAEIAKSLGGDLEELNNRPEKSYGNIALVALQLTPDFKYKKYSLSFSPVLWANSELCGHGSADDKLKLLSNEKYEKAIESYEKKYYTEPEDRPLSDFGAVYSELKARYAANIPNDKIEDKCVVSFQIFKDIKVKERRSEDNSDDKKSESSYMGLSASYYKNDLKMALDAYDNKTLKPELVGYCGILNTEEKNKQGRIDLVKSDSDTLFKEFDEILDINRAPLGKWPSRFMPGLMQEAAINLQIKRDGNIGKVFSVNGPPGTGKTTLLKEIIVNNIVERAAILAKYKNPDEEAFTHHKFRYGEKTADHRYDSGVKNWHTFKDDRINDYGILVASCNNAAVENITKELPMTEKLMGGLKPDKEKQDSEEFLAGLDEVRDLFDIDKSDFKLTLSRKDSDTKITETWEENDIYFSQYATDLINAPKKNNEAVVPAWGIISVALGKKSNCSKFYNNVLGNMIFSQLKKDNYQANLEKYQNIREKFLEQYDVVIKMRSKISAKAAEFRRLENSYSRAVEWLDSGEYNQKTAELNSQQEAIQQAVQKCNIDKDGYNRELSEIESEISGLESELGTMRSEFREQEVEIAALRRKKTKTLEEIASAKKNIFKVLAGRLFKIDFLSEPNKMLDHYNNEISRLEPGFTEKKEFLLGKEARLGDFNSQKSSLEDKIKSCESEMERLNGNLEKINEDKKQLDGKKEFHEAEVKRYNNYNKEFEETAKSQTKCYDRVDKKFINDILYGNNELSTKAQISNPWLTAEYNREREKLFFYAMQLHKYFVLSSESCRENFKTLAEYWRELLDSDNKAIVFDERERGGIVTACFQTLFLLVPVISTTFASLGRMFKDVTAQDAIGTLIVDEAGQASPDCLVGALFRSRKAMIVGDPKQVEPVVTDELDLIKKSFEDEELYAYRDKTLSVQSLADQMNKYGTYLAGDDDNPKWVGCPLLVHRRCISPMYEISNAISYSGIMKQDTLPPKEGKLFVYDTSRWIHIKGAEIGGKNHYVEAQFSVVKEIVETAFKNTGGEIPSLYIISPFTSVVERVTKDLKKQCDVFKSGNCDAFLYGDTAHIGTVHKFQGKEADEVIFLLGCDENASGAVKWVNSNIVNVAVTRAKYRLYIIGDSSEGVWQKNKYLKEAMDILERYNKALGVE